MGMRSLWATSHQYSSCNVQERLHKAQVVNAPPFFNLLWRVVQPLIPAATKERLFVLRNMQVRQCCWWCRPW